MIDARDILQPWDAESKILVGYLLDTFKISKIEQLFFKGSAIGSGLEVYDANILYLAIRIRASSGQDAASVPTGMQLYDPTNTIFTCHINSTYGQTFAPADSIWQLEDVEIRNTFFSRAVPNDYICYNFNGYKLTIL